MDLLVKLDDFEGPLDFLLFLIKKNNLEISRISLAQITGQYLAYLESLKVLDVDVESEFLCMAAEIIHIKSLSLLPHSLDASSLAEEGEPSDSLVARLLEFERYKMAANDLRRLTWLNRDVFVRGSFCSDGEELGPGPAPVAGYEEYDVDMFVLVKAFALATEKLPKEDVRHEVIMEHVSVTDRIYEILEIFKEHAGIALCDLFVHLHSRLEMVVCFLAVLELAKLKLIHITQGELFSTIHLQRRLEVLEDGVVRGQIEAL